MKMTQHEAETHRPQRGGEPVDGAHRGPLPDQRPAARRVDSRCSPGAIPLHGFAGGAVHAFTLVAAPRPACNAPTKHTPDQGEEEQ